MQPDLWKDSYHRLASVSFLVCQSEPRKNNLNLVLRCRAANTFNYATFTLKFYCLHYWAGTRIRVRIPIPVCCPKTGLGLNPGDAVHLAVVSVTHFAPLFIVQKGRGRPLADTDELSPGSQACGLAAHFDSRLKGNASFVLLAVLLAYFFKCCPQDKEGSPRM